MTIVGHVTLNNYYPADVTNNSTVMHGLPMGWYMAKETKSPTRDT